MVVFVISSFILVFIVVFLHLCHLSFRTWTKIWNFRWSTTAAAAEAEQTRWVSGRRLARASEKKWPKCYQITAKMKQSNWKWNETKRKDSSHSEAMHMSLYLSLCSFATLWLCGMMHFSCGNVFGEHEMIPEPFCLLACSVCIRKPSECKRRKKWKKNQTQWMSGGDGANEREKKTTQVKINHKIDV